MYSRNGPLEWKITDGLLPLVTTWGAARCWFMIPPTNIPEMQSQLLIVPRPTQYGINSKSILVLT